MKRSFFKFILILSLFQFIEGYSWGTTGHRVVAQIAENHLTESARAHLKKIIGNQKLANLANWPDFIKSDSLKAYKESEIWHYVDLQPQKNIENFSKELQLLPKPNLYSQINFLKDKVKDEKTPEKEKEIALVFLVHLIGDMEQPLHVGREGDKGGNTIQLTFLGEKTNLHSLWDNKLIDFQKYSYTEYADVLDIKSADEVTEIQNGSLEDWLYDSQKQANHIYANITSDGNYGYDYNYKFHDLLERQLLYGGLRLAKILNEIL